MQKTFIVKDSGNRREFANGFVRDTSEEKIDYSLIFKGPLYRRWAAHLTKGAKKYGKDNWLQACDQEALDRFIESACRHFYQWVNGETDEDHAAAVVFNINGAEYVRSIKL